MGERQEDGTAALIAPSPPDGSCLVLIHSSFPACILSPAQQLGGTAVSARFIAFRPLWGHTRREAALRHTQCTQGRLILGTLGTASVPAC